MKSLVEEASSITKAIEKAWTRAGKPQSFSVKIFENPETGFLGFTKKSAKVGIFFEETSVEKVEKNNTPAHSHQQERRPHNKPRQENRDNRERRADGRPDNQSPQRRNGREHNARPHRDPQERGPRTEGQERPQRRRNDRRQHASPQRHSDNRPPREERPQTTPAPEQSAAPKVEVQSPLASSVTIKRGPKISGRRFAGTKKTDSEQ